MLTVADIDGDDYDDYVCLNRDATPDMTVQFGAATGIRGQYGVFTVAIMS